MSTALPDPVLSGVPRLGFLGLGWIGRARLAALVASGAGRAVALFDVSPERASACMDRAGDARVCHSIDELLEQENLDGIVIATPSALHAEQAEQALRRGVAVFCQKPLGRTARETSDVIAAARAADRLLGVDLSYRWTAAMQAVRSAVTSGVVGDVHAVDLTFHNAYGPDSGWARDPRLAGGGCVIDLGVHLLDLVFWVLGARSVHSVTSQLYARGVRLPADPQECEDFAFATIELDGGSVVRLACSWESSTGQDADIAVTFHGSEGAAGMRNVAGSFHDFGAEHWRGTTRATMAVPPDDWGGRALIDWSRRLADGAGFDPAIESLTHVASTLDAVLGRDA